MKDIVGEIRKRFADKILKIKEHSARRIYFDFGPKDIPESVEFVFKNLGCRFVTATGIDTPQGIEILYHFSFDKEGKMISLCTLIDDKKHPQIKSVTPIIRGAEWIEREMWELLGIDFKGHPNLTHLLLIDNWPQGKCPLRKDR